MSEITKTGREVNTTWDEDGYELGWDDPIENDGPGFTILPEGDYDFEVINFERARHGGSEKLPPCHKAVVHIKIEGKEGISIIQHHLFLHTKTEGLLCAFFTGIGQRQRGERITMDWGSVIGATGRAKVGIRKWINDEGREMTFNEIKKFYEPEEATTRKPSFKPGTF